MHVGRSDVSRIAGVVSSDHHRSARDTGLARVAARMSLSALVAHLREDNLAQGVPLSFVAFCDQWLGFSLTPGQRVLALVAFDGLDPIDLEPKDREIAKQLFGEIDHIPDACRAVVYAVCSARAGKSRVFGTRLLHLALTVPLTTLGPGEIAMGFAVAPAMREAKQVLNYARGAADVLGVLSASNADSIRIRRVDGKPVELCAVPANSALRGKSLVGAVLDEFAFFRDENFHVNDVEVYRAISPRILEGGQMLIPSTPWAEQGLLHKAWKENFAKPETALVAHAPTQVLRDDEHTRAYITRETKNDPDNAKREFGAIFMGDDTQSFFDPRAIEAAIDNDLVIPVALMAGAFVSPGADFAFRTDSSALTIIQRDSDEYVLSEIVELTPGKKALVPSVVIKTFGGIAARYGAKALVADGHYEEAIREHLFEEKVALIQAPPGAQGKADAYQVCRVVLHGGLLRIPRHERLIRQLHEVRVRPTSGGGVSIESPRWRTGGHGDLVSALVNAVWHAHRQKVTAPKPEYGQGSYEERVGARLALLEARKRLAYDEQSFSEGTYYPND